MNDPDPNNPADSGEDFELFSDLAEDIKAVEALEREVGLTPATDAGGFAEGIGSEEWIAAIRGNEREVDAGTHTPPVSYAPPGWDDGYPSWEDVDQSVSKIDWTLGDANPEFPVDSPIDRSEDSGESVVASGSTVAPDEQTTSVEGFPPHSAPEPEGLPQSSETKSNVIEAIVAAGSAVIGAAATSLTPPPVGIPSKAIWHYSVDEKIKGPVTETKLREILSESGSDTLVWNPSLPAWQTASSLGLIEAGEIKPPPLPVSAESSPSSETAKSVCPRCANPVRKLAKYCPSCGQKLD